MTNLQIFKNNKFGQIRTIEENDKVLFCGADIANALGYANPRDAIIRHCKDDGVVKHDITDNLGRNQLAVFINEGNVYRLITHSKLPSAEEFESWVFDEVLPTIRKTGGYVSNDDLFIKTYLPNADERTVQFFKLQLEGMKSLNNKIEQDKPKVLFANAVATSKTSILVGELAKILKQNGVNIGQNRLFEQLRNDGYLISRKGTDFNMPTQRSMELGLFEIKETGVTHSDGHITINKTPKVTGKGQAYFINRYLAERKEA